MQKNRAGEVRKKKQQNKLLQQETKKMEQQLEKIRHLKEIENEKLRLKKQLQSLNLGDSFEEKESKESLKKDQIAKLRDYGSNFARQNEIKIKKKLQKIKMPESSSSEQEDDGDGENVRYFLQVIGMEGYFTIFKENKILNLPKIRNLKEQQIKEMKIPIKDHVKIIKKLREMGF